MQTLLFLEGEKKDFKEESGFTSPNLPDDSLNIWMSEDIQAEQQHIQKHGWKSRKAGNIPGITVMSRAGACVEGIGVGSSWPKSQQ